MTLFDRKNKWEVAELDPSPHVSYRLHAAAADEENTSNRVPLYSAIRGARQHARSCPTRPTRSDSFHDGHSTTPQRCTNARARKGAYFLLQWRHFHGTCKRRNNMMKVVPFALYAAEAALVCPQP